RKHAPNDKIILVGDEPEAPYSRMAIPYLLMKSIGEEGTHLRHGAGHYQKLGIELKQARATHIDTGKRTVRLDDGSTIGFDKLLIATGSSPASPPIPGIDSAGVHHCWTLKDARAIQQLAVKNARVLQMGAGFIGCIIMEALAASGAELTEVEMGDRMVPRMMGPTAGGMIRTWCESKGIRVFTGTRVQAIEPVPGSEALRVTLSSGEPMEVDLVISATGVRPNIGFLENSGITCLQGILTDDRMQTSVPGIYAAGDCAEALDTASGRTIVSAIQPNAADQAYVAGMNMAGRPARLAAVTQINVLDTLGLISSSFGDWQGVPGGDHVELTDRAAYRHLSLQFRDDVLVGCNSVGWTDHVGVMRGLVEGRVKLGEWKDRLMHDPTRLMEAYLARAQAREQRAAVAA
ncbi:MAG TPA: FAD-dependent oxidoreductase, partial [Gemmatimonadales bacterium]|nr:FAD-dependent oxidoreductase [Gemmatimonadales bacterium]